MWKKLCLLLGLAGQLGAAYIVYDDTGTRYLTLSEDAQYIYLWQLNGQLASPKFPYALPDDARLSVEPYFEDIDNDGELEIVAVYQDKDGQYYKLAVRQNGEIFDERNWPRQIDYPEPRPVPIVPIEDKNLLTLDGRDIYNQKYNYYQGLFQHALFEPDPPEPQPLREIYSRQPTYNLALHNVDADFERYLLLVRRDARERYNFFAELASPNTEITPSLNYGEGIYPWALLTYDWLDNYAAQEILYYYDQTPPEYAEPENGLEIYFSPNADGVQDLLTIATTPSDNLYYTQTALLDIFDGPTYIATVKRDALTFQRLELNWNGQDAAGEICPDKKYQGTFYIVDGCGNISRATTLSIVLDTQKPQIWLHNNSGAYFTPNGDGELDVFMVTLNSSEPARAELNIYNAYNRRIKTWQSVDFQTAWEFSWDGLDNDGVIESGDYKYEIILTDRAGNVLLSERYPLFLDYKSPLLLQVGPEQAAYNFSQTGVTFNFEALEPLQTALYIIDTAGEIIVTVNSELAVTRGSHSFTWDGRLNDGIIPDGVYNYRLVARNAYGNANAVSGIFYADSSLPPEANSPVTVNVYIKTANQPEPRQISASAEVKYSVNAGEYALKPESGLTILTVKNIGYLTSRILAEDGSEVAVLAQNELTPAGSREFRYRPAGGPSGRYYFLTEIKDLQNNPAEIFSREEFILDTAPPVITDLLVLNTQAEIYLTTKSIDLEVRATDNLLPVTEITFSLDGQNWDTPNAYTPLRAGYAHAPTDGAQAVYARVKDAAGNWSEAASVSVIVDTTPPRHLGLLVNGWPGGAVGTVNVSINFLAADAQAVQTVKVSYNDAYSWVEYPYGADINFQLDPVAGAKDFYIKYTDALGNESGIYQDTVFLDRSPPHDLRAQSLSPYYTNTRNVVFKITVEDNDPIGVETIGLRNEDTLEETILPYTPSENYVWPLSTGEGEKSLTLVAYDHAGNRGNSLTLNYALDTAPPEIITENIKAEKIYLPTLRDPLQMLITANEPVMISLNVRRDGELVYQAAPPEVVLDEQANYAEFRPELNFGWSGQNDNKRYLRGGATYNIEYQLIDRAGNADGLENLEIYFGLGYELVSADYDLTLPSIQATSKNITVEYEDDPDYSVFIDQDWLQDDHLDNEKYKPSQYEYKNTFQPYTRNMRFRYDVSTSGDDSEGRAYVRIRHSILGMLVDFERRSFGGSLPRSYEENKYMKIPAGILGVQLCAGPADRRSALNAGYDIRGKKIRIIEYEAVLKIINNTSINDDKSYELYTNLDQGNQGTMGNIANAYAVSANNGNIYLSRNGVTINITKYPAGSGIETAEPSMYIVKNIGDRELTGPSEYNAMENVHLVWQQKNSAADKWRIYYAVAPFLNEELPDGGFSIMSLPSAPQTTSAPAPSSQKYFIENVLNYPNPFEDETTLTYELGGYSGEVRARIYTITGRLARTLNGLPGAAGYNEYKFDGNDNRGQPLANDVYYLVILARDERGRWVRARSKIVKLR